MVQPSPPPPPPGACAAPRRVVLAHDWLVSRRGGELVLDAMCRALGPRAVHLLVMFDQCARMTPAIDRLPRSRSWLSQVACGRLSRLRRWLLPAYPAAVHDLTRRLAALHAREPVDLLVSSSSAAVKSIRPPRGVPHLCYIHAPARYLWSHEAQYQGGGALLRLGLAAFGPWLRRWDRSTSANVTRFVANSTHTARLVRDAFGRDAGVLHPPVRTEFFTPPEAGVPRQETWLVVGALEPYKRVDLAIEAARRAGRRLTVIGRGSMLERWRSHAASLRPADQVTFITDADDGAVREAYRSASLMLYPQVEDFGITAVEAQACGLPVVAFGAGGAIDTVIDGASGALAPEQSAQALVEAASRAPKPDDPRIRASALRFSAEAFEAGFLREVYAVCARGACP